MHPDKMKLVKVKCNPNAIKPMFGERFISPDDVVEVHEYELPSLLKEGWIQVEEVQVKRHKKEIDKE